MTFNCKFETPCGWCEKFDKKCKDVCQKVFEEKQSFILKKTKPLPILTEKHDLILNEGKQKKKGE